MGLGDNTVLGYVTGPAKALVQNKFVRGIVEYGNKKYAAYKKGENPIQFINDNIKLVKIMSTINNAIKRIEKEDASKFEFDFEDEEWIVEFKSRLLNTLRQDKTRTENKQRENLQKYVNFLTNKRAVYLCKSPDANSPGDLYYSNKSKMLFLVNEKEIKFFMLYKQFPEKIFWLKENIKKAQEEFNEKQVKMYGANAKDWNGKPIKQKFAKQVLGDMRNPGTTGGSTVQTPNTKENYVEKA